LALDQLIAIAAVLSSTARFFSPVFAVYRGMLSGERIDIGCGKNSQAAHYLIERIR